MITYIKAPDRKPIGSPLVRWVEFCRKLDPQPLQCELPEDLKFKSLASLGTAQTYTYTTSSGFGAAGTSTTTTTI